MQPTALLRQASAATATASAASTHARVPLIRFLGKRPVPTSIDHTPKPHPMSPVPQLPESFKTYRAKAQQHGPLAARTAFNNIGSTPGAALGSVAPGKGEFFDRAELPQRFHRLALTEAEMEAVESGGASLCI